MPILLGEGDEPLPIPEQEGEDDPGAEYDIDLLFADFPTDPGPSDHPFHADLSMLDFIALGCSPALN